MMRSLSINLLCFLTAGVAPVLAQSATPPSATVSSLLASGYAIAGTVSVPSGGGGLYLRKEDTLRHRDAAIRDGLNQILQAGLLARN